uniref:Uncharacterized protein n=1 Tax=viral metagenome TaxID=1070528 RepID=A0A6M3JND6_9ZZZZ
MIKAKLILKKEEDGAIILDIEGNNLDKIIEQLRMAETKLSPDIERPSPKLMPLYGESLERANKTGNP